MKQPIGRLVGPFAGAVVAFAAVACSVDAGDGVPVVAPEDLQADITTQLEAAGAQPQSVSCQGPLVGEIGQSTRCDVVLSPTNSFEPIVTVTAVSGGTIDYELIPALSAQQLQRAVARLAGDDTGSDVQVNCQAGLLGRLGEETRCDVTAEGVTLARTAQVTSVEGLMMNFDLVPVLTKDEVEASLLDEVARHLGRRPDSALCTGELEGRLGNTVDCAVADGDERAVFILTVTSVDGDNIDYSYAPRG
ncbi:DUF4333 domain-containing protein [Mycobacterium sp. smrl_JER01]|uniref:DUF4333 domain-containing protein n=1 Tax=Mycobacterium sp. smrl_JER01 TaxID=3402633 RepID=UPI003AD644AD